MDRLKAISVIRDNLNNGRSSIGSWIQIPHSSIAEIMGQAGYDWVAVDMEHGAVSVHQLPDLFRALELGNTLPLARVAQGAVKDCKQALDAGAGGVIIPMIESAEQLKKVRDAVRWPPSGKRGVAFSRANLFGKNFNKYNEEAQQPLFVAMIEHINAVENLDDILQVEGLDAILVGPYDFSASMNMTAEFDNREFVEMMGLILNKAKSYNIACGVHVVKPSIKDLKKRLDEGYKFLAFSIDTVFLNEGMPSLKGLSSILDSDENI
jgi:2-dehydro-3-deoxyglucarate aldolase